MGEMDFMMTIFIGNLYLSLAVIREQVRPLLVPLEVDVQVEPALGTLVVLPQPRENADLMVEVLAGQHPDHLV